MSGNIVPFKAKYQAIKQLAQKPEFLAEIAEALPNHITKERMISVFLTAITTTPELANCEPFSLLRAVKEASQLGLPTDGILGHGYILPFGKQAKFIPGYRGLMDLARRSGQVEWIQARVVYEGDEFEYEYGLEPSLTHKEAPRGEGDRKVVAVYAAAKLVTGEKVFEVMYREDIEKIRQRSPSGRKGPWVTDWEEMARKTLIRRLMKYLPLSTDVQAAVVADEYAEAGVLGKLLEQEDIDEEFVDAEHVETLEALVADPEDNAEDAPAFEGRGPISNKEDAAFEAAVQDLLARAKAESTEDLTSEMFNRFLGSHGVETLTEIRSRKAREDFYNDVRTEVEAWENLA
ncbi:MAG: recombinase RecT [Planctomycetota bacterium]|jgi:recombination protein RecT